MEAMAKGLKLILSPLLRRVGTAAAVFLGTQGVPAGLADQLLISVGIVAALGFDVALAIWHNRASR